MESGHNVVVLKSSSPPGKKTWVSLCINSFLLLLTRLKGSREASHVE